MTPYAIVLFLHSWVRWAVLVLGVIVFGRSLAAWRRRRAWQPEDDRVQVAFVASVDLQLLLGLVLYLFLSPLALAFRADPGHAVHDHVVRFFGLEHAVTMLAGVALAHVARVRGRRAGKEPLRHLRVTRWTFAALAVFASGIPWPGLRHGRPLARGLDLGEARAVPRAASTCPPRYVSECATCHGRDGRGGGIAAAALTPPPRDFTDPSWGRARRDDELLAVIRDGGGRHGLSAAMPPHASLDDDELRALVGCVRSFGSRSASPADGGH